MSAPNQNITQIFQIQPLNYPNTLLLGTNSYTLNFSATNLAGSSEKFQLSFKGEGLEIEVADQFTQPITFEPNQSIQIAVKVTPTKTGQAKIIIESQHHKMVHYTELVWHIRDAIEGAVIDETLAGTYIQKPVIEEPQLETLSSFYSGSAVELSLSDAKQEVEFLMNPPVEEDSLPTLDNDSSGNDSIESNMQETDSMSSESPMDILSEFQGKSSSKKASSAGITQTGLSDTTSSILVDDLTQNDIDERLAEISRGVFNANKNYAIEVLENIKNQELQQELLTEFFIPIGVDNLTLLFTIQDKLDDKGAKTHFIKDLIKHYFMNGNMDAVDKLINLPEINPHKDELYTAFAKKTLLRNIDQSLQFIESISDPIIKQDLLKAIAGNLYDKERAKILQIVPKITDRSFQYGVLFEIIKTTVVQDKSQALNIVSNMAEMAKTDGNIEFLKHSVLLIADIKTPKDAVDYISSLDDNLKEALNQQVHDKLWIQVEEPRTRIDKITALSVYYSFNTAVKPTKPIEMVHDLGGNISENLLSGEFTTFIGVICPFSFNFPIFPPIQQSYAQIKTEKGKSFYYMIIPTKIETEEEFLFIQTLLNTWFVANEDNFNTKVYMFNLDFIPYLSKPTIIMGSDKEDNMMIESVVKKTFNQTVSFIIDDGLFKGGMVNRLIQKILPRNKFKVLNLVMTYDFLNNYNLFKQFMDAFVK